MEARTLAQIIGATGRSSSARRALILVCLVALAGCGSTDSVDEPSLVATDDAPRRVEAHPTSDASEPAATPPRDAKADGASSADSRETADHHPPAASNDVGPPANPPAVTPTQQALRERAERYWSAKQAQDWATAFEFEPRRIRENATVEEYVEWKEENEPLVTEAYEIDRVLVDASLGWVDVTSRERFRMLEDAEPQQTRRWEKWWHDGEAWMPVPAKVQEAFPESPAVRDADQERVLREAVIESWEARRQTDWGMWYDLIDPRDTENIPRDEFIQKADQLRFLSYDVKWVQVIGERGRVRIEFMFKPNDPSLTKLPPEPKSVTETWVPIDGVWYQDFTQN
jgi:hypothetical protein